MKNMETYVADPEAGLEFDEDHEVILFPEVVAAEHGPPNTHIVDIRGTNEYQTLIQLPKDEGNEDRPPILHIITGTQVPEVEADKARLANLPSTDASVEDPDEAAVQVPAIERHPIILVIGSKSGRGSGS